MSILFFMVGGTGLEGIWELIRYIRVNAMELLERRRFRKKVRKIYRR